MLLAVRHTVHLRVPSSLGHRMSEPQVMQFPEAKSLVEWRTCPPRFCRAFCGLWWPVLLVSPSLVSESQPDGHSIVVSGLLFLMTEKRDGKGLLMERAWRGLAARFPGFEGWSESEELESSA